jgi:CRP-like cAMP-binding protein
MLATASPIARSHVAVPAENSSLAALTQADLRALAPSLEPVRVSAGQVLSSVGQRPSLVFFPGRGTVVSSMRTFRGGTMVECALTGSEGIACIDAALAPGVARHRAVAQTSGYVWRIPGDAVRALAQRGGPAGVLVMRQAAATLLQSGQAAGCNRLHRLDRRLARWLLMVHDRAISSELALSHDELAQILGTRRAGVSEAVAKLAAEGMIERGRTRVVIRDAEALRRVACECYDVLRGEMNAITAEAATVTVR